MSARQRQPPRATPSIEIRPFDAPLGAEVLGLDLSRPLSTADFSRIHRAHLDHHVLVFRDQRITPQQHVDFSRRFGPLQIHVLKNFQLQNHPEILVVSNIKENGEPIGLGDAGHFWHSDLSYKDKPSLGSLLHAQELPAEGGDTLFANQHTAWDTLPAASRPPSKACAPNTPTWPNTKNCAAATPGGPSSPRNRSTKSNRSSTRSSAPTRNRPQGALRQRTFHHPHPRHSRRRKPGPADGAVRTQLTRNLVYRHQWQAHDLVFWDNRSVTHLAAGTPDHLRRKLYRTTIEGDAPF
jgi:taurine dioxygenase